MNRMWEETALRSWVTMQWGNPSAGPNTPSGVADNAQQAYCHVLDMNTNTDPAVQMTLTNAATGLSIDSSTAEWLFSEHGWIDLRTVPSMTRKRSRTTGINMFD